MPFWVPCWEITSAVAPVNSQQGTLSARFCRETPSAIATGDSRQNIALGTALFPTLGSFGSRCLLCPYAWFIREGEPVLMSVSDIKHSPLPLPPRTPLPFPSLATLANARRSLRSRMPVGCSLVVRLRGALSCAARCVGPLGMLRWCRVLRFGVSRCRPLHPFSPNAPPPPRSGNPHATYRLS